MEFIWQNIISALTIGGVIGVMATISNNRIKAVIYSLPIPMSIAYIATGGTMNSSHVIGLFLVTGFLWLVRILHDRGFSIINADVIAAMSYIILGYFAVKINVNFFVASALYACLWATFIFCQRHIQLNEHRGKVPKISPPAKGLLVSIIAFGILNIKSILSGIAVTFPFSGVFAVIESQHMMRTLVTIFMRNSIAILALFISLYVLEALPLPAKLIIGWLIYLIILKIVSTAFPLKQRPD